MWCIRVYKRYSTGKIEGFKLIDENTMEIKEISTADLKRLLVYDPNSISNITLDKNMNPILSSGFHTNMITIILDKPVMKP